MSGLWNPRRLLQFLTENRGKLLMLALVVASVCCVVALWIGVSLGVIVLIMIFAWWWKGSSSAVKKAAVILNVPTSSKPLEVRDATLTKVQTLVHRQRRSCQGMASAHAPERALRIRNGSQRAPVLPGSVIFATSRTAIGNWTRSIPIRCFRRYRPPAALRFQGFFIDRDSTHSLELSLFIAPVAFPPLHFSCSVYRQSTMRPLRTKSTALSTSDTHRQGVS
jgi:hypothetical protein